MSRMRELVTAARMRELVTAIRDGDEAMVEAAVLRVSRSRRWLAPLALAVGALEMLFEGVKLVFSNWRLTVVQILPAMWIWLAMLDLKAHALHGKSFHALRGPIVIPLVVLIAAITAAAFFLNAVFAFAIAKAGPPEVRTGVAGARRHLPVVLGSGAAVGLLLGLATIVVTRWGRPWFALSLGVVIGLLMVCYVAVPSSLIGIKPDDLEKGQAHRHRRERSARGRGQHAALPARPHRHPHARLARALHPGHLRRRRGVRVASRRDGSGQGGQAERSSRRGRREHPRRRDRGRARAGALGGCSATPSSRGEATAY